MLIIRLGYSCKGKVIRVFCQFLCKIACRFRQCAGEGTLFYGYKLHAVCGLNEGIHSSGLTKASVHDLHYLKDVKAGYAHCTLLGDKDYASVQVRLDLFESARIRLEAPCRKNQRDRKPAFQPFAKARKRMETVFSQLCDQSMIVHNHAKDTERLFTRIIGKINALTILQYINPNRSLDTPSPFLIGKTRLSGILPASVRILFLERAISPKSNDRFGINYKTTSPSAGSSMH